MRFHDLIVAIKARMRFGPLIFFITENRESEFHECHEQLHQTSRNRDTRFPDKAYSVWATQESVEDRWQVKGWEPSEDQRIGNRQIGIPMDEGSGKSLEETPTRNLNRPFGGTRVRSTEEVGDRQIANSKGKEHNATRILISRNAKSRVNLDRQIQK
jgi:hypothetical protein